MFELRSAAVRVHGVRQGAPPRMLSVEYELAVDTDESDWRLDLLHCNLQKYGIVFNTLTRALDLTGAVHHGNRQRQEVRRAPASRGRRMKVRS